MPGDDESISDEAIWETLPVSSTELANLSVFMGLFTELHINYSKRIKIQKMKILFKYLILCV